MCIEKGFFENLTETPGPAKKVGIYLLQPAELNPYVITMIRLRIVVFQLLSNWIWKPLFSLFRLSSIGNSASGRHSEGILHPRPARTRDPQSRSPVLTSQPDRAQHVGRRPGGVRVWWGGRELEVRHEGECSLLLDREVAGSNPGSGILWEIRKKKVGFSMSYLLVHHSMLLVKLIINTLFIPS